jgi:hypothetical protein
VSLNTNYKLILALACTALCTNASAEIITIKWQRSATSETFAQAAQIAPKKVLEICGKINQGIAVDWIFSATAPLDFNVHFHLGKDVTFLADLKSSASASDTLRTPSAQDYCWMWTNQSPRAVTINVSLKK